MITNNYFTNEERVLLNFILSKDIEEKEKIIDYINALSSQEIVRDYSPFYKIMEFRTKNITDGYVGMRPLASFELMYNDGSAPTEFTLYEKNGLPFEYEIYNADSSEMNMKEILLYAQNSK